MKRTGLLLKEKREAAKLSISEVALATKINPKILSAIEEGDETRLPAKTFLKGFLRSYAQYLRMDVDEVMRVYTEEMGGPAPTAKSLASSPSALPVREAPSSSPTPAPRRRMGDENSSGMRTAAVIVIVFLIGLIIGVRELIEKYQREKNIEGAQNIKVSPLTPDGSEAAKAPEEEKKTEPAKAGEETKPAEGEKTAETKPEATKPVETKPSETKPTEAKPEPTSAEAAKSVEEKKPAEKTEMKAEAKTESKPDEKAEEKPDNLPPPSLQDTSTNPLHALANVIPPSPLVKAEKESKTEETAAQTQTAAAAAEPEAAKSEKADATLPAAAQKLKNEIILEALDKVEVRFQIKGETKRVSLGPTQVHTILSDQPVTLDLSDGGAVNIIVNGKEQGPPGDLGKPKQIRIP